ncbi:ropporin-1-like protein [Zootermopsis nevadensis]|uniref:ropporin-1-like protein n=1 Tax=Zootermopsis nevadensis TaxID=136037 RepID=UPI000B8E2742|nr:ropporin-1-like protein [Zootermopsis nevadensis]
MPDLVEQMYSSQQIYIPPTFPFILKQYAKAAIRTQPYDLLRWSSAYFRAMAQGEEPPVKKRLEYPLVVTPSGLSPGYLKVLLKQIGTIDSVSTEVLRDKWQSICLDENALNEMLKVGGFTENVDWLKFIAIAAGHLTNSLTQTMYLICELLTEEPEGGSDAIPFETFKQLYVFLAEMNCGTSEKEKAAMGKHVASDGNTGSGEEEPATPKLCSEINIPGIGPTIKSFILKNTPYSEQSFTASNDYQYIMEKHSDK